MKHAIDNGVDSEEDYKSILYICNKFELYPGDEDIPSQVGKTEFGPYIHSVLKPCDKTSLQDLKLELDNGATPIKWLELITTITNTLRDEIFQRHLTAAKEIKYRYSAVGLCLNYQLNELNGLLYQKSLLQQETLASDIKCEKILKNEGAMRTRLNDLLMKLGYNSSLSIAEVKVILALTHTNRRTKLLKEKLDKLNMKANYYFIQSREQQIHVLNSILTDVFKNLVSAFAKPSAIMSSSCIFKDEYHSKEKQKSDNDVVITKKLRALQYSKLPVIEDYQKKSITPRLKIIESDIVNLMEKVKMAKTKTETLFSL